MAEITEQFNIQSAIRNGMIGIPVVLLSILAMLVVPMPPIMLDLFFSFNIALAMVVILSSIYTKRPLDFAVFPTVLLLTTLLRLALNIASTRIVLLDGHTGTDAAGHVIQAFGDFVIGGNYTVGLVVFAILVIINFVVVTKGAGRISEVSARFTLDAMPGKQMAIDADLNAGIITQEDAKRRRAEVVAESDFYGAMDGASKFVRGDAIAGILILFINIIGGLSIGTLQHGMSFSLAVQNYTLLTIGDGLVAQIPSLLLSTAAAIMVTRVSSEQNMGQQIIKQMFDSPKALAVTSLVMGILGVIPGMPNMMFLALAALSGAGSYIVYQRLNVTETQPELEQPENQETTERPEELTWDDVQPVDTIGLEVGYKLIPLVDIKQGGQLMSRIRGIRKKMTQDLGFLLPTVHIRDNLDLPPNRYRISLLGVNIGGGEIYPERMLAINPGQVYGELDGLNTRDPAFGMQAVWIDVSQKDYAQSLGYTVVDPSTVVATHLSQIMKSHAHELLGREEVQQLLDNLAKSSPKLVDGFVPDLIPLGVFHRVLKNLLEDGIPIRDIRTIVETIASEAHTSQDPDALTAVLRTALKRLIVQNINDIESDIPVITLNHELEQILQNSVEMANQGNVSIEPGLADRLHQSLSESAQQMEASGKPAILLVPGQLRQVLSKFIRHTIPAMHVLAYNEIPDNRNVLVVATIGS